MGDGQGCSIGAEVSRRGEGGAGIVGRVCQRPMGTMTTGRGENPTGTQTAQGETEASGDRDRGGGIKERRSRKSRGSRESAEGRMGGQEGRREGGRREE